jgi:outer membrane protein assembly factor BamB
MQGSSGRRLVVAWWFVLLVALAVLVSPVPAVAGPADWPQLGHGPSHAGYQAFPAGLSPSSVDALGRIWRRDVTPGSDEWWPVYAAPVVSDRSVFAAAMRPFEPSRLVAFDASTGQRRWRTTDLGPLSAAPAVSRGIVVVNASYPFEAVAFDATTGETLWRQPTTTGSAEGENFQGAAPVVIGGVAIVSTTGDTFEGQPIGRLWAFDLETGEVLWDVRQSWSRPAATARGIFIGRDNRLVALDLADGSVLWWTRLGGATAFVGAPGVSGGTVYVPVERAGDDLLVAVAALDGTVRWRTQVHASLSVHAPPSVSPNRVVAETIGGRLVALHRRGGRPAWIARITPSRPSVWTCVEGACASPASVDGVVFAVAGPRVRAFRLTDGAVLWGARIASTSSEIGLASSPAIANGILYVGSDDGFLYAFG